MEHSYATRALYVLGELQSIRGYVPRDLRPVFEQVFNRMLPINFFAPRYVPPRHQCEMIMRNGNRCSRKCGYEESMCMVHVRAEQRRANPPPPKPKCTQLTAAGQPCKRGRIPGSTACKTHAKRDGLMPVVPTECCICYEELTDETRTVTPCNHHFHKGCVGRWFGTNSSCPMCRTTVPRATRTRLAAAT